MATIHPSINSLVSSQRAAQNAPGSRAKSSDPAGLKATKIFSGIARQSPAPPPLKKETSQRVSLKSPGRVIGQQTPFIELQRKSPSISTLPIPKSEQPELLEGIAV